MNKESTAGKPPSANHKTTVSTIALYNLKKYIRYQFKSQKEFVDHLVHLIQNDESLDTSQTKDRRAYVQKILRGDKALGPEWQSRIERLCEIPVGALRMPAIRKVTAYVLVNCRGKDAQKLYDAITENPDEWPVVDEIGLVTGNSDLFVRIHGSEDQITTMLTDALYNVPNVQIQGTNTLFSFRKMLWQRYPIRNRVRDPSPPYWLPSEDDTELQR